MNEIIYEYTCKDCGCKFDVKSSESDVDCPLCRSNEVKLEGDNE